MPYKCYFACERGQQIYCRHLNCISPGLVLSKYCRTWSMQFLLCRQAHHHSYCFLRNLTNTFFNFKQKLYFKKHYLFQCKTDKIDSKVITNKTGIKIGKKDETNVKITHSVPTDSAYITRTAKMHEWTWCLKTFVSWLLFENNLIL